MYTCFKRHLLIQQQEKLDKWNQQPQSALVMLKKLKWASQNLFWIHNTNNGQFNKKIQEIASSLEYRF